MGLAAAAVSYSAPSNTEEQWPTNTDPESEERSPKLGDMDDDFPGAARQPGGQSRRYLTHRGSDHSHTLQSDYEYSSVKSGFTRFWSCLIRWNPESEAGVIACVRLQVVWSETLFPLKSDGHQNNICLCSSQEPAWTQSANKAWSNAVVTWTQHNGRSAPDFIQGLSADTSTAAGLLWDFPACARFEGFGAVSGRRRSQHSVSCVGRDVIAQQRPCYV